MSFLPFRRRKASEKPHPALRAQPSFGTVLSAETEAFLSGRMAEHLAAAGRPVPAWAVLNKLAHATAPELAEMTGPSPDDPGSAAPWWSPAQAHLAACLLDRGAAPDDIGHIQRTQLIPLELSFIEHSKTRPVTSREVISAAYAALKPGRPNRW
jgi:hypothetical protein